MASRMPADELAERITGARVASRSRHSTPVDPYVAALSALSDLVVEYFRARVALQAGDCERGAALDAYTAAEMALVDAVGKHAMSRITGAIGKLGLEYEATLDWEARVMAKTVDAPRPSRPRRIWNWLTRRGGR